MNRRGFLGMVLGSPTLVVAPATTVVVIRKNLTLEAASAYVEEQAARLRLIARIGKTNEAAYIDVD